MVANKKLTLSAFKRKVSTSALTAEQKRAYAEAMKRILAYAEINETRVYWGNNKAQGEYITCRNKIRLSRRFSPRAVVHTLLHELGHAGLEYDSRFRRSKGGAYSRTVEDRLYTLEEEFEAWRRARVLALELQLPIDMNLLDRRAQRDLMSYVNWVVNPATVKKHGRSGY